MQGFELTQAAAITAKEDEGTWVELIGLDDEPMLFGEDATPVAVLVAGTHSARYRQAERAVADGMIKKKKAKLTSEEANDRMMSLAVACVIEWRGFFDRGTPIAFTPENVRKVFTAAPWIYAQVVAAMQDHARFFTTASAS
jgi:hypothetical protein